MAGVLVAAFSHSGDCDGDLSRWQDDPRIVWHRGTPDEIRAELKEYGTWEPEELKDDAENRKRILWLAAGDIRDQDDPDCSAPVGEKAKPARPQTGIKLSRPPVMPALSNGSSQYGAQMGRRNALPESAAARATPCRLRLVRLKWIDGDYDQGGAYWGATRITPGHWQTKGNAYTPAMDHVFRATGEIGDECVEVFVRAVSREDAKAKVRESLSGAKFFR